jgi:hypothetical protein
MPTEIKKMDTSKIVVGSFVRDEEGDLAIIVKSNNEEFGIVWLTGTDSGTVIEGFATIGDALRAEVCNPEIEKDLVTLRGEC